MLLLMFCCFTNFPNIKRQVLLGIEGFNDLFFFPQLFGFVCDKRKHQAAVVVLLAAMSVQGIMNLQVQFVSILLS